MTTQEATPEGTINYVYDPVTQEHVETYTDNTDTLYRYDDQGNLTTLTLKTVNGTTLSTAQTTTYGYDALGNMTSEVSPNGITTTYAYDGQSDMASEVAKNSGGTLLFQAYYTYNAAGDKTASYEKQLQTSGTLATINTSWTYDAMGRLTGETLTSTLTSTSYVTTNTYDLDSDMLKVNHTGPGDGATGTTTFVYNSNNELTSEVSTVSGTTTFTYDNNGSQLTVTNGSNVTSYSYDVRNKMITDAVNSTTVATYLYDDAGDRVQETTGGTTSFYLTDTANPTGFDQPTEVWTSTTNNRSTATLQETYIIGDRVLAQADSAGNVTYLLVDGHGSTRLLVSAAGAVTGTINYDAFGGEVSTSGSTNTIFRFAGDGPTDLATGIRMPGDGTRDIGEGQPDFIERDIPGPWNDNSNPVTLNAVIYGDGDPVDNNDPTGHYGSTSSSYSDWGIFGNPTLDTIASVGVNIVEGAGGLAATEALAPVLGSIAAVQGLEGGFVNMALAPTNVNSFASFGVGFAGSFATSVLRYYVGCVGANAVGGALTSIGNDWLANPNFDLSSALSDALVGGGLGALLGTSCFVAGTPVLLGDGRTEAAINDIEVGQRVATDGGAANSPTGTAAADPNATEVDPKTWREVTIDAGDWEVKTLEPEKWIKANDVADGSVLPLADFVNVAEMGVPAGFCGTVESITACPKIQGGPGRVVLTTVSHLNDDLYHLTLKDAAGQAETLGVTGTHLFFDETTGWTEVQNMYDGETLRGADGVLTVVGLTRDPGMDRVYNMTVETDHVYYVGDLPALVHNTCNPNANELHHMLPQKFEPFFSGELGMNIEDYAVGMKAGFHRLAATNGIHAGTYAKSWNGVWEEWIAKNGAAGVADVLAQLEKMIVGFKL